MKIIFAGTADFALPTLHALLKSSHEICAIYTQPDRPAGRGQKLVASPVKNLAVLNHLPIYQPTTLKDLHTQQQFQKLNADILVNVAYGLLIPEIILNAPKFGCINIHPSLLPRWRGAAPIQRSIMAGDTITGITIMKMDMGFDTGDIYKQITMPITETDTTKILLEKTANIGAELLLKVLTEIESGSATATPQTNIGIIYAHKITKEEGKIDWTKSAKELDCMIRAFNPWPIAYTEISAKNIRIWQAEPLSSQTIDLVNIQPGTIVQSSKQGIDVVTGDGLLRLLKLQLPGSKPLPILDILNAHQQLFAVGQKLPC